jgi:hypothetical protein
MFGVFNKNTIFAPVFQIHTSNASLIFKLLHHVKIRI